MRKPSPATAIALAALVVALGGVAFAQIPSADGTIHACYSRSNGNVRLVESPGDCRSNELATRWNQEGPQGATGATGPTGPTGTGTGTSTAVCDEAPGEVTTQSTTPADLGGPSVTVTVGANGIVSVFARADAKGQRGDGLGVGAHAYLFEPTDFDPAELILPGGGVNFTRHWTSPLANEGIGSIDRRRATWLTMEATPGVRTFSLRYAVDPREDEPPAPPDIATFRNRKLCVKAE